ncbi:hypothetical protein IDG80_02110 [Pelagibacterales bacterium SAG-MED24]|nr:hypothetical protein [Pelagibacterales bacterium SAG-MED24]
MLNIVIFFLTFYILLISVLGYGIFFQNLFYGPIKDTKDEKIIYVGFYGLFLLTLISFISSLLVAHNFIHNILLHIVGVLFFVFLKVKNKKDYLRIIFLISLFTISALLISKTHDDFSYYHLPFTKYLTEHKVIFGMSNLGHGFNFVSSLFFLNSTFYLPLIEYFSFHFSLLFFLIFFNFFLFKEILSKNNPEIIKFLYMFAFAFFNLSFNRIAEFGTDKVGQLLIVILIIKLFQYICFDQNKSKINNILFLIPLLGLCISLKTYFLSYILLGITIIFLNKEIIKSFKTIFYSKAFVIFLTFLSFYFLHHFISTGCLISPMSFTCFGDNLDWARNNNYFKELSFFLEQWAKAGAGPNFRVENPSEYIQKLNWVSHWTEEYFIRKGLDQLGILISVFLVVFLIFKKFDLKFKALILNQKILLFYTIILIIFLIWFLKHPSLRYGGYSILFLAISIPTALMFSKAENKNLFGNKFKYLAILVIIIFNFKNINRVSSELKQEGIFKFDDFPFYTILDTKFIFEKSLPGLTIYKTNGHCWGTPTPCTGSLKSKINVKKKYGYYFLYK